MIIECKNCLKKFSVKDQDIPKQGRTVQCGNCSTQWFQKPADTLVVSKKQTSTQKPQKISSKDISDLPKENENLEKMEFRASDGKEYKFLGSQWAEILPSGNYGKLARKNITKELNKLSGRKIEKKEKEVKKTNEFNDQYKETSSSMGFFSFLIVSIMFIASIILFLDTFKNLLIPFFPNLENYLIYIFESLNNIYIIIKDIFNNYK